MTISITLGRSLPLKGLCLTMSMRSQLIILPEAKMENINGQKKKDTDVVSAKYIFCTNPDVHFNEAEFTLENADIVKKKYQEYRKSYMQ